MVRKLSSHSPILALSYHLFLPFPFIFLSRSIILLTIYLTHSLTSTLAHILITVPLSIKFKAPSDVSLIICFISSYLSLLPFSPFFLPTRVQTDSCGPCGFALWATCSVMWKSFTRAWSFIHRNRQLSQLFKGFAKPLRKKNKKNSRLLWEVQLGSFVPLPSFPFENILFHWAISCLSRCVISSFSIQKPPPLLANICVVRGGEILEPLVYF